MKKLALSILFIIAGLFIVDRLGGKLMWWVNQNTNDVSGPKIKYLVNNVHEDVILMGTSRCNSHYVPSIVRDSIGMSVFNGGIDGSNNIYAHYIILNHILKIHTPKVICLELMDKDFYEENDPYKTVSFFAPYYGLNESADSVFDLAGKAWQYKLSHLYRYNAKAVSNIAGLGVSRQAKSDNGYIPNPKPAHIPNKLITQETPKANKTKQEYLQRYIDLCKSKGIKLIFMISPMYSKVNPDYYDVLKNIADKNNIPFLDYHSKGLFLDHPEYFRDFQHLWEQGAAIYSSIFASDLKRILKEKNIR